MIDSTTLVGELPPLMMGLASIKPICKFVQDCVVTLPIKLRNAQPESSVLKGQAHKPASYHKSVFGMYMDRESYFSRVKGFNDLVSDVVRRPVFLGFVLYSS